MNILFTCAGRRNYLLDFFRQELKGQGKIVAADMQLSAPAMAVADIAIVVPAVYNPDYIETLLEICKKESIQLLISLNDLELPVLSEARESFKSIGVNLLVSSDEVVDICFDKMETIKFSKAIGLNIPKTYLSLVEAKNAIINKDLVFPLVIKPRWGSASIGIEFPESVEELELAYKLLSIKLNRSILAQASQSDYDHAILIQEKIDGTEYGLDVLNDLDSKPIEVFVKEKLAMRAGETDKAVLRNNPELEAIGKLIGEKLGHVGNLDCDIFERDNKYYLLEMNPRFGGGYPFTHMAGGNYPSMILSWFDKNKFSMQNSSRAYDQGFAKCDTLIKIPLNN
jgi:carbamoyl-phosphate synthase large subunit